MEISLTVSELTTSIKSVFNKSFDKNITVIGEIANFKINGNNTWFDLKDDMAQIKAVMFDNQLNTYSNGKNVKVTGSLSVFPKQGTYNFLVKKIELIGTGNLFNTYISLKEHYEKLGYFDEKNKKQLKSTINTIGLITSKDGAAIQDFIHVLNSNNYLGTIYVKHTIVQGKDCPKSVVNSLLELDKLNLDVIVITRGGGSFDDLFGFSDALVIETIHNMKSVVISAIGHDIDNMLSDFVADVRAATPTSAGNLLAGKSSISILDEMIELENTLKYKIMNKIKICENELKMIENVVTPLDKIMDNMLDDVNKLCDKLNFKIQNKILGHSTKLNNLIITKCENHVILDKNSNIIDNIEKFNNIKNKDKLTIRFVNGSVTFSINDIKINV